MSTLVFLDTNVFVYAYDNREPAKQRSARALLKDATADDSGVISSQVMQEFCNVAKTKLGPSIRPQALTDEIIDEVMAPMLRHVPDIAFYKRALGLLNNHSLSFYDALIVQAALDIGCETLYSEDLQAGQKFGKMTVKNPFTDD